ncbi:vascular endothelial growth factor receptor 1-like isoform X2 [Homarus americanus]|nr:vascular endothelial growth factor receptor 1-like isoform X2 [Homarus americanus]
MKVFSILPVLLLWQVGSTWSIKPPRLNVTEELIVGPQDEFFSLRCEGTAKMHWSWTADFTEEDIDVVKISYENHPHSDYTYVSTLTVTKPQSIDTGFYFCAYEGVRDYKANLERADHTYIYVFDGSQGLVNHDFTNKRVTTADELIIGCRTTLPNITVELFKNDEEKSSIFDWDPKIGFVRRNLVILDSGTYTCMTKYDSATYAVQVDPASVTLPKPAFEKAPNQHFVKGQGFKLTCSLILSRSVAFHWTLPNPNTDHQIEHSKVKRMNEYRLSTLHVLNATTDDSGEYICQVSAEDSRPNQVSMIVEVKESLTPYINISTISKIKISEGEYLKWKATIFSFPSDPEIVYRDREGKELIETNRITTEHNAADAVSWLKIWNTTAKDFGKYILQATTRDGSAKKSATVDIEIESRPVTTLRGVPSFVTPGDTLSLECEARGFPLPKANWTFRPCPNGTQNCTESFMDIKPENLEDILHAPGNIKIVKGDYTPQESGILHCDMSNKFGNSCKNVSIILSDIGGTFVFRHTGQNKTTGVPEPYPGKSLDVIVNDDFSIMCGASKFDYKSVQLQFHGSNLSIFANESEVSRQKHIMEEKVTFDLQGDYTCTAQPHDNLLAPHQKIITINVLAEERVKFTRYANMYIEGQTVVVKEKAPFSLNCTVTGTPKPTISWYKDNELLTFNSSLFDNETTFLSSDHQRLLLKYVFKEKHVGHYTCRAENRLGPLIGFLSVSVPRAGLSTGAKVGLVIAFIGIVFLVVVVVVLIKRVKTERKFRKSFRKNELYLFEKGNIGQLNPDCTADEQAELLPYDPAWEVPKEDIKIGKQLGSGAFGRVVKAVVSGLDEDGQPTTTVALKMCKSQADQSQVRALALELKIMIHLGKHLNIVNLMGANTANVGKGELWILVEYCRFGNLLLFMHRHRKQFINQIDPVTGQINHSKLFMDPTSPLSPTSESTRTGYRTAPITDQDGYLAPKFNLAAPPQGRNTMSPPQSPTSLTGSSGESFQLGGHPRQHMDNPIYSARLQRSVSDCPEGDPGTRTNSGGSQIPLSRLQSVGSSVRSDNGSVGYSRHDMPVINTDMTTLHSVQSPLSPSPMSPTDSSYFTQLGLDSQGNPFPFETGHIPGVNVPFTTSDLLCWAWQVAQGMDYLTSRKVLHGDLAARNLLLADNNVVKISDFGLSREMYKKDVYMKKGDDLMPIKWMSIEAIRDRIFSVQSDVWAYAVTLWELFSLGSTPYPGIEVNKDFLKLLEDGFRMDRPKYANQEIYDLLLNCWASEPRNRPGFQKIAECLGVMMLPDLRGRYMTMNDPYLLMNEEHFRTKTDYLDMLSSPDFDNLNREDDETRAHYVNIQNGEFGNRDDNYLNMRSPDLVGYSRVGMAPDTPSGVSNPHYLHMNSTQGSPTPTADVFSPRPDEISRFTFGQGTESSRLTELPEEDEGTSQDASMSTDHQTTENSSLINGVSKDPSQDDALSNHSYHSSSSQTNSKKEETLDMDINNGEMTYINLPMHGSEYANL